MMNHKIMTGFAALALAVGGWAAVAQQDANQQGQGDKRAGRQEMHQRHMEKVAQELNLNDQQKQQFDSIMKANMEKMRALREQQEAQMKQLHESALADLSKVLTPEQMTKFKDMHQRVGPGMGGHEGMKMRHKHRGPGGPDGLPPPPKD